MQEAIGRLEQLGYPSLWYIEAFGREPLTQAALLLGATERMTIAPGIVNVWSRDATALEAANRTLSEAYPGRFVLGVGISHAPVVEQRGHDYERPLEHMRRYLEAMDGAPLPWSNPDLARARVLAALGPRMLELAAERTAGALTYHQTPEHTAKAREILGREPLLAVEQAVILTDDRAEARRVARGHLDFYLGLPNYVNSWRRLGFTDDDFGGGGSDRLCDALVLSGGADAVLKQVERHFEAGADHVCLQVLDTDPAALPERSWEELAAALSA